MHHELPLRGLDGANPLGFLAALGTLRALTHAATDLSPRMSWRIDVGGWRPVLTTSRALEECELAERLNAALRSMLSHAAWSVGNNLNVAPAVYREYAKTAAMTSTRDDAVHAEYAAAFASEAVTDSGAAQTDIVADTALRTMSGAGHQHFVGFMQELIKLTTADDIAKSLFQIWRYDDDKPSMRWDPSDDRRYALRWDEPSGDPIRTMRGANRLAIEGLPLLPVMPRAHRLETTGFVSLRGRGTFWTWPLWDRPIPLSVVRSLLADRRLKDHQYAELAAMGVCAVYRSQRLTVGKYRNFTMGIPA